MPTSHKKSGGLKSHSTSPLLLLPTVSLNCEYLLKIRQNYCNLQEMHERLKAVNCSVNFILLRQISLGLNCQDFESSKFKCNKPMYIFLKANLESVN